jgi:3-hydroxybutyryl-CoA dehydrogenase
MNRIGVVGTGVMAKGICFSLLAHGYGVDVFTRRPPAECLAELSKKSRYYSLGLNKNLEPLLPELRIHGDEHFERGGELVIECSTEEIQRKTKVLSRLSASLPEAVIVSNTSSLSIQALSRSVENPSRFAGMHFMNPPHLVHLVEVVRCADTSDAIVETIQQLCQGLGKECIVVPDIPGFVVNRLLLVQVNEAFRLIDECGVDPSHVELAMTRGAGWPIGPIRLTETISTDVCLRVLENIYEQTRLESYRPSPLLRELVRSEVLGAKNGTSVLKYLASRGRARRPANADA